MTKKGEPWYLHAGLIVVIIVLVYFLVQVAIIEPSEHIAKEKYFKTESRLRMDNLRQAEILYEKVFDRYSGNLDTLINFVKYDTTVAAVMSGIDTITNKSTNPFLTLSHGEFTPDSLYKTPKSFSYYILQVDTVVSIDTSINRYGRITKIDTTYKIGTKYYIEDPDGYGSIGSLTSDALKNTASWE
ncbi:MAG: hypothetical protein K8F36_09295 [Melioribacteraceae bacterium]|nr:hypothetical protein [Melioribacteraceae bacterium]MCO6473512.1 hypothetical protein [Melioribacteraceae bacterium]MDD3558991.1 hypothetical protein [Melioribacteraceae bacterium]